MFYLYITLGIILGLILIGFILGALIHHKAFGKRWEPDGIIKYYHPSEYEGLQASPIAIPTKKGILRGYIYSYKKIRYQGICIFSHGMWGSHNAYIQEIEHLAKGGFQVLGFDYYGTELSDGKSILGLGNSILSLDSAVSYIRRTYPDEKIYVMGHSWGGFAALSIAKYHPEIERIVAMAPFINIKSILKHMLPKLIYPILPFILIIDAIYCGKKSFINAKKVVKNTKIPTLIIHSLDDNMIPYSISTEVLRNHVVNQKLVYHIVDGKNHNPDYTLEALAYTKCSLQEINSIMDEVERTERKRQLDYYKMGEIDEKVFNIILDFLKS
ncbi:MAG: lysophospholipase [Anaeroplasmataceae bacterium]|nr:lysophospholipase [Anaeroplasmataceae bacterium]